MDIVEYFETYQEVHDFQLLAEKVYLEIKVRYSFDYSLIEICGEIFYKVEIEIYGHGKKVKKED